MKRKPFTRILSLFLVVATLASLFTLPASAASLNGSGTVNIQYLGECPNAQLKKIKKGKGDRRAWMSGTIAVLLKPEAVIGPYENS